MAVCSQKRRGCFGVISGFSVFMGMLVGGKSGDSSRVKGVGAGLGTEA